MDAIILAKNIADQASKAKALNIKILDLRSLSSFTDFFVICSGTSNRQIRAISDRVVQTFKKENLRPLSVEGYEQGEWIVVDYVNVVLHIFGEEARARYDLEGFWGQETLAQEASRPSRPKLKRKRRETQTARRGKSKGLSSRRKK